MASRKDELSIFETSNALEWADDYSVVSTEDGGSVVSTDDYGHNSVVHETQNPSTNVLIDIEPPRASLILEKAPITIVERILPNVAPGNRSRSDLIPGSTLASTFSGHRSDDRASSSITKKYVPNRSLFDTSGQREPNNAHLCRAQRPRRLPAKSNWADSMKLVSARRAEHTSHAAIEKAEKQKYLDPPEAEEEFPSSGCYLWPYWYENPVDLLGWRMEDLNPIRTDLRVWIEWDKPMRCMIISSRSIDDAGASIHNAIAGIRQIVQHSKSRSVLSTPLYIISPPTSGSMRALVGPKLVPGAVEGRQKICRLELKGEELSKLAKKEWMAIRDSKLEENICLLREHLQKTLKLCAPVRDWMRLRLHFGHIVIEKKSKKFESYGLDLPGLKDMLDHPMMSASVDRNLGDAKLALRVQQKIIKMPDRFCSAQGNIPLENIKFKDTEIIHFAINNQLYRIEGILDRTSLDNPNQEYQAGSIALYKDNQRNILTEIRQINIEKDIDWKIELIKDNEDSGQEKVPKELHDLIYNSIPARPRLRVDSLGLQYPEVVPRPSSSVKISSVCMRSVIQYRLSETGYIVELAIYRNWPGASTLGEPDLSCSVSMYHQNWDDETQDISKKLSVRQWKDNLSNFFHSDRGNRSGLELFLNEVQTIQGFIADGIAELSAQ